MATCSEFKEALTNQNNVDMIVERLGHLDWTGLLVKFGGLEKKEADEIKLLTRDSRKQLRAIIIKIVEKDSNDSYIGLSQVLEKRNSAIWEKVFPFKPEHGKLVTQPPKKVAPTMQSIDSPYILWLCGSKDIFDAAKKIISCHPDGQIETTPGGKFIYCKFPSILPGSPPVWLFGPVDNTFESLLTRLLQQYSKSNYFIFTGSGTAVSRHRIHDNDTCVVKPRQSAFRPLVEELCHMTLLWDMNPEIKKEWQCSKVVFGTTGVGGSGGGNNDVTSTTASAFNKASDNLFKAGKTVPNAAILSVTKDDSRCSECKQPLYYHSVYYTYHIIKYLLEKKLLLDCF